MLLGQPMMRIVRLHRGEELGTPGKKTETGSLR